ncbi:HlyC/CorC family transporter [Candidatus Woesearchaeota archaeon]|nr:HlyC/CorC family transporter [Nanoarchaeota archaeon]MCB9370213.1 HlyC/CorC family transporter [Candidatus Woesearchaeota archaeon]
MDLLLFVIVVPLVVILSALISGSEAALLSINYSKVRELVSQTKSKKKLKKAKNLLLVKENLENYITTIVVLNNVVNIVGSMYLGFLAAKIFGQVYLGVVSGILTFMIILFSEIIPKIYGDNHSQKIALSIARPLIFLTSVLKPVNFVFVKVSKFFVKERVKNAVSEGEISEMALMGHQEGSISNYEKNIIRKVFRMNDIEAYDIMVPKNQVAFLESHSTYPSVVKLMKKTGFTRFPVLDNGEVIGFINVKDLITLSQKTDFSIEKNIRPLVFVPESMKLSAVQETFRKEKAHIAGVVNEHGDLTGIVTLEDIIEELLGDIRDEFDPADEKPFFEKVKRNTYRASGNCEMSFLLSQFKWDIALEEQDYTTLNGFLVDNFGRIPLAGQSITLFGCHFTILKASKRRILLVEIKKI